MILEPIIYIRDGIRDCKPIYDYLATTFATSPKFVVGKIWTENVDDYPYLGFEVLSEITDPTTAEITQEITILICIMVPDETAYDPDNQIWIPHTILANLSSLIIEYLNENCREWITQDDLIWRVNYVGNTINHIEVSSPRYVLEMSFTIQFSD